MNLNKLFNNPFFDFMGNLADMVMLNLVFVLTSIPIVTIGASQTALYKIMLRKARKRTSFPIKEYFQEFKNELKQSTKLWLVFLITLVVLVMDVMIVGSKANPIGIVIYIFLFIWLILFSYVFPLQAQFENTAKNTVKNAMIMSMKYLPFTLLIVFLNALPIFSLLIGGKIFALMLPIWTFVGLALIARVNTAMFVSIFNRFM